MIAPLKQKEWLRPAGDERGLRRARRMIVELLGVEPPEKERMPSAPAWQAWCLALWVVFVAVAYMAAMIRSTL